MDKLYIMQNKWILFMRVLNKAKKSTLYEKFTLILRRFFYLIFGTISWRGKEEEAGDS